MDEQRLYGMRSKKKMHVYRSDNRFLVLGSERKNESYGLNIRFLVIWRELYSVKAIQMIQLMELWQGCEDGRDSSPMKV